MIYRGINLQTLQDKELILLIENKIRGGFSSIIGDRYVRADERKIKYIDSKNLYGWAMSDSLPYDHIKNDESVHLEVILSSEGDSDVCYLVEVDMNHPDETKEKIENFPFCPENKMSRQDKFSHFMREMKPNSYTQNNKFKFDWFVRNCI